MSAVLANILSTRLTILEELQPAQRIAHTRVHFRTLGRGQRPVQFAALSASYFRRELELELQSFLEARDGFLVIVCPALVVKL